MSSFIGVSTEIVLGGLSMFLESELYKDWSMMESKSARDVSLTDKRL